MNRKSLDINQIRKSIRTQFIGRELHYFASTGSTNTEAKRLALAGATGGTLVLADEQTAGRGRMGRRWVAPPNTCLLMSLILRPELEPVQAPRLTMLCSLATVRAIKTITGLVVGIKWPNDLVVVSNGQKKIAGLLTETCLIGNRLGFVIVGMGINVNLPANSIGPVMTPATSLLTELERPVNRATLLISILEWIEELYPQAIEGNLATAWAKEMVTLGQSITVTSVEQQIEGVAESIDPSGALLVRDLAGKLHPIHVGDVTLRTPSRL